MMKLDDLDVPAQPEGFELLCERVGLAIMLGQKVQFALAAYYSTYQRAKHGATAEAAKDLLATHLSKPMGVVISAIEKTAPLPAKTWEKVKSFQQQRNWLVHDFDEEATPRLARGEAISDYTTKMEEISHGGVELMQILDDEGRALTRI